MIIEISVTDEHIWAGEPLWASRCPVALAARDAGLDSPMVTACLSWGPDLARRVAILPDWLVKKIRTFDTRKKMEPFTFALDTDGLLVWEVR